MAAVPRLCFIVSLMARAMLGGCFAVGCAASMDEEKPAVETQGEIPEQKGSREVAPMPGSLQTRLDRSIGAAGAGDLQPDSCCCRVRWARVRCRGRCARSAGASGHERTGRISAWSQAAPAPCTCAFAHRPTH